MSSVFVVDACRTPIGKVKGALADVRPDHLAADILKALVARNQNLDVAAIDDVYWGAATGGRPRRACNGNPPGNGINSTKLAGGSGESGAAGSCLMVGEHPSYEER